MRLLFCVQRYGEGVAGGSEAACRAVAERLAARGHVVEVVTSRARSYVDWIDEFPPGSSSLNGVLVHRLAVREPRDPARFAALHGRLLGQPHVPLHVQRDWLRAQGPDMPLLTNWLRLHARRFDVAIFFTYLYPTAVFGLPMAARYVPTVLVPTAHDEPMIDLRVYDALFRRADGLACLTPEELGLLRHRFRVDLPAEVVGLGVDPPSAATPAGFREQWGLASRPYVVFLGRLDPGKGSDELVEYFVEYKRRHPSDLALVIVGEPVSPPAPHPDVIVTGFVDDETKAAALTGATLFVQPSYFESFSIALCEAWLHGHAALVQARCEVLAGQCRRSGGGIAYDGLAEFAESLTRLLGDPQLRDAMGAAGRQYVLDNYQWDTVIDRYERFVAEVAARSPVGLPS